MPASACWRTTFKNFFDKICGQGGRHFIEQQDVGLAGKRARQIEDAQSGQWKLAGIQVQPQIGDAEFSRPMQKVFGRRVSQSEVIGNAQIWNEGRFLIDWHEPRAARDGGRGKRCILSSD